LDTLLDFPFPTVHFKSNPPQPGGFGVFGGYWCRVSLIFFYLKKSEK